MSFTKVNFDALDASDITRPVDARFARTALQTEAVGVSRFRYPPGERLPFGHKHTEQEEVYVVVGGSGRANLDGEIVDLAVGDAVRVAPAVARNFEAGPDGLELICVGGPRPAGGDGGPAELADW